MADPAIYWPRTESKCVFQAGQDAGRALLPFRDAYDGVVHDPLGGRRIARDGVVGKLVAQGGIGDLSDADAGSRFEQTGNVGDALRILGRRGIAAVQRRRQRACGQQLAASQH